MGMDQEDELSKSTNLNLANLNKSQLLSKDNSDLIENKSSLNNLSQKLNEELEPKEISLQDKKSLLEQMRLKHKQISQNMRELENGNERIKLTLNLIEQMCDDSYEWTNLELDNQIAKNIQKKEIKSATKT